MELRIRFMNSAYCVLIFLVTPSKGNYDADAAQRVKEVDIAYGEKLSSLEELIGGKIPQNKIVMSSKLDKLPGITSRFALDQEHIMGMEKLKAKHYEDNKLSLDRYLTDNRKRKGDNLNDEDDDEVYHGSYEMAHNETVFSANERELNQSAGTDQDSGEGVLITLNPDLKVSRVTKCTTSLPIPTLSEGFFPYSDEYFESRGWTDQDENDTNKDITMQYLKPSPGPMPLHYVDDE